MNINIENYNMITHVCIYMLIHTKAFTVCTAALAYLADGWCLQNGAADEAQHGDVVAGALYHGGPHQQLPGKGLAFVIEIRGEKREPRGARGTHEVDFVCEGKEARTAGEKEGVGKGGREREGEKEEKESHEWREAKKVRRHGEKRRREEIREREKREERREKRAMYQDRERGLRGKIL